MPVSDNRRGNRSLGERGLTLPRYVPDASGMAGFSGTWLLIAVFSATAAGNDQQPSSISITPDAVRIGECYVFQVGNGAHMTLDLRYTHDEGETQTLTGWPTLDGEGKATACPTLTSQLGNYEFTGYRNTRAVEWLSSSETLEVIEALEDTDFSSADATYRGQVSGIAGSGAFARVTVLLTGPGVLRTVTLDPNGRFEFQGLADGVYALKVSKPGHRSSPARSFRVSDGGKVSVSNADRTFHLEPLGADSFVYHWEEDQSTSGYEYSAHVNEPREVEFLDEEVTTADSSSSDQLLHDYNIALVDDGGNAWTDEHAYRLWQTMESIPQRKRESEHEQSLPPSRWLLVPEHIADDIQIDAEPDSGSRTVSISVDAFVYASPRIVRVEGKRGAYYSKRLHHALVRFVTDNGHDEDAYERILQERFGVTTRVSDHTTYRDLTAGTTDEPAWRFQEFHAEEIVRIINTFEEMPAGMHSIAGLRYLARRLDGTAHPLYPTAPAVAWTGSGYIEFMETAFDASSILSVHRLILHEKAHFLWAHLFDEIMGTYSRWFTGHGPQDAKQSLCRASVIMPHYMPSSIYSLAFIRMSDWAGNEAVVYFRHPGRSLGDEDTVVDEAAPQIELVADSPDSEPPELDLDNIRVQAEPTQPDDPNGETRVTLEYRLRDNISGVRNAHVVLRDPQGIERFFHLNPEGGKGWFPSGDPSQWTDHSWTLLLPAGSAPGVWGIAEVAVWDRVDNVKHYNFTEIIHFDVE